MDFSHSAAAEPSNDIFGSRPKSIFQRDDSLEFSVSGDVQDRLSFVCEIFGLGFEVGRIDVVGYHEFVVAHQNDVLAGFGPDAASGKFFAAGGVRQLQSSSGRDADQGLGDRMAAFGFGGGERKDAVGNLVRLARLRVTTNVATAAIAPRPVSRLARRNTPKSNPTAPS